MALNPLFNLDPTKFGLGKGSGTFRRVNQAKEGVKLDIGSLLAGISSPGPFTGVAPNLPTNLPEITPIDPALLSGYQSKQSALESMIAQAIARRNQGVTNPGSYDQQRASALQEMQRGPAYYQSILDKYGSSLSNADYVRFQRDQAATYGSYRDQLQSVIPTLQTETSRYNTEVGAYKAVVDPYKDDITAYKTAAEDYNRRLAEYNAQKDPIINNAYSEFQKSAKVSPDKRRIASTGEELGATDLYSDELHNQMLQRIAEVTLREQAAAGTSLQPGVTPNGRI